MVIFRIVGLIALFLLSFTRSFADDVRVSVQLDQKKIFIGKPIIAILTIQHDRQNLVDVASAHLEGKPIKIQLTRDVAIDTSPLTVSLYKIQLPAQEEPGTKILKSISVKVGNKIYTTTPLTYEVSPPSNMTINTATSTPKKESAVEKSTTSTNAPYLKLEPFIEGKTPLYVGQKMRVGYRLYFNATYDLDQIVLPLLGAKGFKKIGTERLDELNATNISARQIDQEIQAVSPGEYTFGPSYIIGSIYGADFKGEKQLLYNNIRADAPKVTIKVLDFPEQGMPTSFNGSVGEEIAFKAALKGKNSFYIGDKLTLELQFLSQNKVLNIHLPELCCQPGFPGLFQIDDIPPISSEGEHFIVYPVTLRVLSDQATAIPSIEFSYFNPKTEAYTVVKSHDIPIKVSQRIQSAMDQSKEQVVWPVISNVAKPIEIKTIYPLEISNLQDRYFGTWKTFLMIPFVLLSLLFQISFREYHKKMLALRKIKDSDFYLRQLKSPSCENFYYDLNLSLMTCLYEMGFVQNKNLTPIQLPEEGLVGEVRQFLCSIEEKRFAGQEELNKKELISLAESLFYKIKGSETKISNDSSR